MEYSELNKQNNPKFTYNFGGGRVGLYSELNNMILCMLFCLKYKLQFRIYSKDASFCSGEGWNKYFKPFCKEVKNPIHRLCNKRYSFKPQKGVIPKLQSKGIVLLSALYEVLTGNYLTQDFFFRCRTRWFETEPFDIPELGIRSTTKDASAVIINSIYRFNNKTQTIIDEQIRSLSLPEHYIGIHVRAGDKIIERALHSIDVYIKKAEENTSVRNAFILTDDYSVIELLKNNYPKWSFYTLTFPDERGFVNTDFMTKTPERKEAEMIKVLASVEVMRQADFFIGTFSSNIGMFLGMCLPDEKLKCIDSDKWFIL